MVVARHCQCPECPWTTRFEATDFIFYEFHLNKKKQNETRKPRWAWARPRMWEWRGIEERSEKPLRRIGQFCGDNRREILKFPARGPRWIVPPCAKWLRWVFIWTLPLTSSGSVGKGVHLSACVTETESVVMVKWGPCLHIEAQCLAHRRPSINICEMPEGSCFCAYLITKGIKPLKQPSISMLFSAAASVFRFIIFRFINKQPPIIRRLDYWVLEPDLWNIEKWPLQCRSLKALPSWRKGMNHSPDISCENFP